MRSVSLFLPTVQPNKKNLFFFENFSCSGDFELNSKIKLNVIAIFFEKRKNFFTNSLAISSSVSIEWKKVFQIITGKNFLNRMPYNWTGNAMLLLFNFSFFKTKKKLVITLFWRLKNWRKHVYCECHCMFWNKLMKTKPQKKTRKKGGEKKQIIRKVH